jgi:hypothetical protein
MEATQSASILNAQGVPLSPLADTIIRKVYILNEQFSYALVQITLQWDIATIGIKRACTAK